MCTDGGGWRGGGGGAHMPTVPYAENGPEYAVKFAVST